MLAMAGTTVARQLRGLGGARAGGSRRGGGLGPSPCHRLVRCRSQLPDYLALDDEQLWQQCQMETFRASGPGGQHRNKVESAVRVKHTPTDIVASATEKRSQHENRREAVKRLRSKIALKVRRKTDLDLEEGFQVPAELAAILPTRKKSMRYGQKHREYPRGVQVLMDLLVANNLSLADTARCLNLSTGALSRLITADNDLLSEINQQRQSLGMRPLRK
ncbi:class I peptide chain release factor [Chloropicon primus]|uniref:Class I peptide chain release factor n=1 Tax=Chloropicon primus TaxID=1764295 RepID=A0A5B8ME56_9CHLO|nr:class I peptide chain release factor [Chloropicon primus]UPQ96846.1 class I peptide chain release factor [Chloropicon primus]|eukprot:QDZ17630.1 class I peptide chain release factor [Chloropicon primus]